MTSSDRDVKYQTLTGAWCEYERSKKGCGEADERFDFAAGEAELVPVPQVDTEITLNLSGTEVCNINHLIDTEYEVTTLPYTSVSHVSDTSIDSTDIKCVQKLNSSEMSLDIDDSEHHHHNNATTATPHDDEYMTNRNAIETKLSTPEPPLLDTSDDGRILERVADEAPSAKAVDGGDEANTTMTTTTLIGADHNSGGVIERFSVVSNNQLDCNQFLNLHRQSSSGSLVINQDCVSTETTAITGIIPSLPSSIDKQEEMASSERKVEEEEKVAANDDDEDDEVVLDGSGFAAPAGSLADDDSDGGDDKANCSAVKECTMDDNCSKEQQKPSATEASNDDVDKVTSPQLDDAANKADAIPHDNEVSTILDLLNRAEQSSSIALDKMELPARSSTPHLQEHDEKKSSTTTPVTMESNTITNSAPPIIPSVEDDNNAVVKENDENQIPQRDVVTTQSVIVADSKAPVSPVVSTAVTTNSDVTLAIKKELTPVVEVVDSTATEQSLSGSNNAAAAVSATTAEAPTHTLLQKSDEDTLSSSETELVLAAEQEKISSSITTPSYKLTKGVIIKKEKIDYELSQQQQQQQAKCASPSAATKKPLVASPVYIKSSIPTGKKLTIVRNLKTVPIKPIYKFDKVSIKTMGSSKTAGVNGNPVVHRFKNLPTTSTATGVVKTFQPTASTSPGVTKVQTSKPPNIFNLLKGERGDKYKTIGNRIVVPMDLKTLKIPPKRPSTVLGANNKSPHSPQRPMVVIKKGNTLCPGTISTLPRPSTLVSKAVTSSSSSGNIIHRVSQINIVSKNSPSVIKRFQPAAATNLSSGKLPGRQQLKTFSITSPIQSRLNSSPNLPMIRQYKSSIPRNAAKLVTVSTGGQECTRLNKTSGSPATSTHTSPLLIGRHNWSIKKEIKQENISSSSSANGYHHRPSILHGYNYHNSRNNHRSPDVKGLFKTHNSASRLLRMNGYHSRARSASPRPLVQPFDVFDELTNLDWLKDDDRSLLRQIRKLNPDDPGIGMSGDESDGDGFADKRRDNKSIFTAYSKVYGPNYCTVNRAHTDYEYDPNSKPPYSFSSLIFMAVEDSDEKKLPVKDIYHWVCRHFPYFRTAPPGWKNSIRHNLSLNRCFKKADMPHREKESAKGALWCIDLAYRTNLVTALKRSPYYPYLHPVGFNSKEPLKNLTELLPGMKKECPPVKPTTPAAEEPTTTTDSKDLWADPVMASAALELMRLKGIVEGIHQRTTPNSNGGNTVANSIHRSDSSESVGKEELVITDPVNEEHTYSSPNSKNKKQQQRKREQATTSAANHRQQQRCGSPTTSDKSAPDAAYEFGIGGVTSSDCDDVVPNGGMVMGDGDLYIDEVDLTEIGNEVEIVSDTDADDDDTDEDNSQMLFDSGFASLKQFSMRNRRAARDDDDDERLSVGSATPSTKWYMSDDRLGRRDDDDSSDTDCSSSPASSDTEPLILKVTNKRKAPERTEPVRRRGRRSKNAEAAATNNKVKSKVRVGRPSKITTASSKRKEVDVADTVAKRRKDSSSASKNASQPVRTGKVGRPRGPVRKAAMKATSGKSQRAEKKVATTSKRSASLSSSNSHYHTRSSGHKLMSQDQKRASRKRRMKTSESSSGRSADDHRNKTRRKPSADGAAEAASASHGDIDQMLAAAECLLSLGLRRDDSNRSTSSIDTQNTNISFASWIL